MGTVYLCLRLKDKKKFAVKKTKFFSRQFDYENIHNFVKDIELYSSQPGNEFIVKYIDFWLEENYFSEKKLCKMNNRDMYIVTDYFPKGNLKEYLLKGYALNEGRTLITKDNYLNLVNRVDSLDARIGSTENAISDECGKNVPNEETLKAFQEVEDMEKDPTTKTYHSVEELKNDLKD
jgi:serine/threonine protein kinase